MEKQISNSTFAAEIIRGKWLLADAAAYLPTVFALLSRVPIGASGEAAAPSYMLSDGSASDGGGEASVDRKVAVLPLHGTMTKYKTCGSDGTAKLAALISECASREDIAAVVLDIDSGGGAGNAVPPLLEAIAAVKKAGKPVLAHCDLCCSAAFWVASQCDLVYLDNDMSEIGSVGAVCTLSIPPETDPQTGVRIIPVYARESGDKNGSYRKAVEGDYGLIQDELSPIVTRFQEAVKSGRPMLKAEEDGVLTGKVFICADALRLGFADAKKTLAETVEAAFALSEM